MAERRLIMLTVALVLASAGFLGLKFAGPFWFVLELRALKLASLIVVGVSVGVATVAFQTVTANRILTPSIMGVDALFVLNQTLLVAVLGGLGYALLPVTAKFVAEAGLLVVAALLLFGFLLSRTGADIERLLLVGIIFGVLFRSLATFIQRILEPSEFSMIQGAMFASFGAVNATALAITAVTATAACTALILLARHLDVLALGRRAALPLGLPVDSLRRIVLGLVAALVAASTALVGPITFFGLLVASLAHTAMGTYRHRLLLPAAGLIAALVLVLGQTVFERLMGLQSTLSVIVEFAGGLFFLYLVFKGRAR